MDAMESEVARLYLTEVGRDFRDELELYGDNLVSTTTSLLQKRRQLDQVEDLLAARRKEFVRRQRKCDKWEQVILGRQAKLEETIAHFEVYVRDNDQKRQRALTREVAMRNEAGNMQEEIERLKLQLASMTLKRDENTFSLRTMERFKEFLEEAVHTGTVDVENPEELLDQLAWLLKNKRKLIDKGRQISEMVDAFGAISGSAWRERHQELLTKTTELAAQQELLDKVCGLNQVEERKRESHHNSKITRANERLQSRAAIANLFERCKPKQSPSERGMDLLQMLSVVGTRVADLKFVVEHKEKIMTGKMYAKPKPNQKNIVNLGTMTSSGGGMTQGMASATTTTTTTTIPSSLTTSALNAVDLVSHLHRQRHHRHHRNRPESSAPSLRIVKELVPPRPGQDDDGEDPAVEAKPVMEKRVKLGDIGIKTAMMAFHGLVESVEYPEDYWAYRLREEDDYDSECPYDSDGELIVEKKAREVAAAAAAAAAADAAATAAAAADVAAAAAAAAAAGAADAVDAVAVPEAAELEGEAAETATIDTVTVDGTLEAEATAAESTDFAAIPTESEESQQTKAQPETEKEEGTLSESEKQKEEAPPAEAPAETASASDEPGPADAGGITPTENAPADAPAAAVQEEE